VKTTVEASIKNTKDVKVKEKIDAYKQKVE